MTNQVSTIPNGWKKTFLAEALEVIIDHRGLTPKKLGGDWSDKGYRAISAKSIKDGHLVNEDQMNLLSEPLYKKWMRVEIKYADIFMTSEAPLGEHLIWKSEEKLVLSQRIFGIRTKAKSLDPFYFNYFIDSDFYQHELKSRESGSTVSGIKQSELLQTMILLPTLPEQQAIAAVLSSLDNKIELLREQNRILETIARLIFKEWFVKFNLPGSTGKMIDSKLGKIPFGWKPGNIGEVLSLEYGKPMKDEDRTGNGFPVFGSNGVVGYHKDFLVEGPGIVVGRKGTMGSVTWVDENFFPIDTTFFVKDKLGQKKLYFHYLLLLQQNFKQIGSDSAVPGLNRSAAYSIETVIPKAEVVDQFSSVVDPIFQKRKENNSQIKTLTMLRDFLLPRLLSGKIRVNLKNANVKS